MENKVECEIVQDLLLSYVDDVLNPESKKLVEKHLSKCNNCQERLTNIKNDIAENENREKKKIDYLKKIRLKNRIKSVILAIGIIFLIVFVYYFRKFIIINDFTNKAKKSLESNNFYKETSQVVTEDRVVIKKEWYKDGKYKLEMEFYSDDGIEKRPTEYATVNSDERIIIDNENRTVKIKKGSFTKTENDEQYLKYNMYDQYIGPRPNFEGVYKFSISSSTRDIGREYYVFNKKIDRNHEYEVWIDKDTGLPLKETGNGVIKSLYRGTNVVKYEMDMSSTYKYDFNIVTDSDVDVPDYSNYEIEYIDTNI